MLVPTAFRMAICCVVLFQAVPGAALALERTKLTLRRSPQEGEAPSDGELARQTIALSQERWGALENASLSLLPEFLPDGVKGDVFECLSGLLPQTVLGKKKRRVFPTNVRSPR
jgi:hypothetical protein